MATIDNLQINVSSNVNDVTSSFDRLGNSVNKLKKGNVAINSHTKAVNKSASAVSKSASTWAKLGRSIGRIGFYRSIRWAIKNLSQGIKEGTDNFYEYSKTMNGSFAQSMDKAATSIAYLKNSLGTAFAPLVEMAVPYLEAAVDKFVEFINKINETVAYLRGEDYFYKAVKNAKQYNTAVKEAKKSLLGFDEINRLSDNSSSNSIYSQMDFTAAKINKSNNSLIKMFDELGLKIEDVKPILEMGAGLIIATLGAITGNIPLAVAGLFLAGKGITNSASSGTLSKLFGEVGTDIEKNAPVFLTGAGLLLALLGFASSNIALGLGGLALAAVSIYSAKTNEKWSELFSKIVSCVTSNKEKILIGIGLVLALVGLLKGNLVLGFAGLGLAAVGIVAQNSESKDIGEALSKVAGYIDSNYGKILIGIGLMMALSGFLRGNWVLGMGGLGILGLGAYGEISGESWSEVFDRVIGAIGKAKPVFEEIIGMIGDLFSEDACEKIGERFERLINTLWDELPEWVKLLYGIGEFTKFELDGGSAQVSWASGVGRDSLHNKDSSLSPITPLSEKILDSGSFAGTIGFVEKKKNPPPLAYAFATGGFPEDGLFFANHTELVGQFSNGKTAVANNAQIVEGISEGVYEAVTAAMNGKGDGTVCVYLDGKLIARETAKRQYQMSKALGV